MSEKLYLAHYGTPHEGSTPHSGRYEWGSGEEPHQHRFDLLYEDERLRKEGLTEKERAKILGFKSTGELRARKSNLSAEKYAYDAGRAYKMKYERQMSNSAIAKELGVSDHKVAQMLENPQRMKDQVLDSTTDILRKSVADKTYVDVGEGVERSLGISRTKLDAALDKMKEEGYVVKNIQVSQINSPIGAKTTIKVLAPEGTTGRDLYEHMGDIQLIKEYHSADNGLTYGFLERPVSVDSKRIEINYADENGFQPKDGIIELRPGVADISLGDSHYAQVRIAVDDKYYLKGMALYSNDLPDGIDIRFNTNKMQGAPMEKVFKKMNRVNPDDPNSPIDWDNPFGATIKAGGQDHYTDEDGKSRLSCINKVNEEGDWGNWDKTLASQFLSKQDLSLAKRQLNITYLNKEDEFDEILKLTNPAVKERLLQSFADDCDAAASELKAAALPRQATQVLLPLSSMKENEVFAPNFKDGEHVCLVRYPHSGPSEIPDLVVNNKNKEAIAILGKTPKDCVVINPKVAAKLSGADFDGDSVVVIPNRHGKTINTSSTLEGLKDFDPHIQYAGYEGMKVMKENQKGKEMGMAANLITDMTLQGCTDDELARAIKYSMVVIDAPKHELDWKRAASELRISELRKTYQGSEKGGASTLISRAKSQEHVPERRLYSTIDKVTGKKIYSETGNTFTKTLKSGEEKVILKKTKSNKMAETEDAFTLVKDPSNPLPMEEAYAIYANRMKDMANRARLEMTKIEPTPRQKSATEAYAPQVASLRSKLNTALSNAPHERQAQMAANVVLKAKTQANPNMTDSERKKKGQQALNTARATLIPGGRRYRVEITDDEWEAIQAGAISFTELRSIINNSDLDKLKELATPRETKKGLSQTKIARAKAMLSSGLWTQAEIAEEFGISTTTLMKYVNE